MAQKEKTKRCYKTPVNMILCYQSMMTCFPCFPVVSGFQHFVPFGEGLSLSLSLLLVLF